MGARLVRQPAGAPPIAHALDGNRQVVGRGAGCSIRIEHKTISKEHCAVTLESDRWHVEDLNSANGTFVNGRKVTRKVLLHHGDVLRCGPHADVFTATFFEYDETVPPADPPEVHARVLADLDKTRAKLGKVAGEAQDLHDADRARRAELQRLHDALRREEIRSAEQARDLETAQARLAAAERRAQQLESELRQRRNEVAERENEMRRLRAEIEELRKRWARGD